MTAAEHKNPSGLWFVFVLFFTGSGIAAQIEAQIRFHKNFEGGSLGKVETLAPNQFRCYVEGQHDEHARNRQANWYYFSMEGVQDREVTLKLTDFVGEYNGKPGS